MTSPSYQHIMIGTVAERTIEHALCPDCGDHLASNISRTYSRRYPRRPSSKLGHQSHRIRGTRPVHNQHFWLILVKTQKIELRLFSLSDKLASSAYLNILGSVAEKCRISLSRKNNNTHLLIHPPYPLPPPCAHPTPVTPHPSKLQHYLTLYNIWKGLFCPQTKDPKFQRALKNK